MVKTSVIIPTYKRQDSLERLLDSLANQTLDAKDFEVIVVDDGSPEGSAGIKKAIFPFLFKLRYPSKAMVKMNKSQISAFKNAGFNLFE